MAFYETLFIVRPDLEEGDLDRVIERVDAAIKSSGGTVSQSEVWGRRRLAYEVKHYMEGIYVRIDFESSPEVVQKLRDHFRFNEDVIRNIIIRRDRVQKEQNAAGESATVVKDVGDKTDEG